MIDLYVCKKCGKKVMKKDIYSIIHYSGIIGSVISCKNCNNKPCLQNVCIVYDKKHNKCTNIKLSEKYGCRVVKK